MVCLIEHQFISYKDQLEELTNQIKIINERNKQMEQARNETRISKGLHLSVQPHYLLLKLPQMIFHD